jgi:hypothetical protein
LLDADKSDKAKSSSALSALMLFETATSALDLKHPLIRLLLLFIEGECHGLGVATYQQVDVGIRPVRVIGIRNRRDGDTACRISHLSYK